MSLSFYVYYSPMYLFNLDEEYVDWDTFSFIGEKVVTATLQVWAQAEGEDWEYRTWSPSLLSTGASTAPSSSPA